MSLPALPCRSVTSPGPATPGRCPASGQRRPPGTTSPRTRTRPRPTGEASASSRSLRKVLLLIQKMIYMSCRWRYWSRMLACCVLLYSRKYFINDSETFFIRDKYCPLTVCLHLMESSWTHFELFRRPGFDSRS